MDGYELGNSLLERFLKLEGSKLPLQNKLPYKIHSIDETDGMQVFLRASVDEQFTGWQDQILWYSDGKALAVYIIKRNRIQARIPDSEDAWF